MNRSSTVMYSSDICARPSDNDRNVGVASLNAFHVYHAVFFPSVPKTDTVSHPVYAWNIGKALDLRGPRYVAISCAGTMYVHLKYQYVPNATQSSGLSLLVASEFANNIITI